MLEGSTLRMAHCDVRRPRPCRRALRSWRKLLFDSHLAPPGDKPSRTTAACKDCFRAAFSGRQISESSRQLAKGPPEAPLGREEVLYEPRIGMRGKTQDSRLARTSSVTPAPLSAVSKYV